MPASKATLNKLGNTVIREDLSRTYEVIEVSFTSAAETVIPVLESGYPFVNGIPASSLTVTNTNQMLVYSIPVTAGAVSKALLLVKGNGAIVNGSKLPLVDYSNAALTQAMLRARLESNVGVKCRLEGPSSTQLD